MKKRTSQDILAEALHMLMRQRPFDKISIQEILDASGISRTTFYKYFYDKEELLKYIIDEKVIKPNFNDFSRMTHVRETEYIEMLMEDRAFYMHAFEVPEIIKLWQNAATNSIISEFSDFGLSPEDLVFVGQMCGAAFVRVNLDYLQNPGGKSSEKVGWNMERLVQALLEEFKKED